MLVDNLGFVPDAVQTSYVKGNNLGFIPDSAINQPSQLSQVVNSPGIQAALGAGDALRNTIASGLNMLTTQPTASQTQNASNLIGGLSVPQSQNIPQMSPVNSGNGGLAYGVGNILGNTAGFLAGAEGLDAVRAASEGIPLAGRLASALGGTGVSGIARRAIGSGLYGAVSNQNNRAANAGLGAGVSLATESIPGMGKLGTNVAQYLQPQKYAKQIIDGLSGGQTQEDATKSVLTAVKNSYEAQTENASDIYNAVRDRVPSGSIYGKIADTPPSYSLPTNVYQSFSPYNILRSVNNERASENAGAFANVTPTGKSALSPESISANTQKLPKPNNSQMAAFKNLNGQYPSLDSKVFNIYKKDPYLQNLHNNFVRNPNFDNGHALQSELGVVQNKLSNGNGINTIGSNAELRSLGNAREAIKGDLNTFLSSQDPQLALDYQNASNVFKQNVVPYRATPKIFSIANGDTTNIKPSNLSDIFAAPDVNMSKIISDLPSGTMDKVLYTKLGKVTPTTNPFTLLTHAKRLDEQGLGSYISPELSQQLGSLQNRINWRSRAQSAAGAMLGAAGGAEHGAGGAVGMGLAGASFASPVMNFLGRRLQLDDAGQAIANVMRGTYPIGRSAYIANRLNYSGVNQ